MTPQQTILEQIAEERRRQRERLGDDRDDQVRSATWLAILREHEMRGARAIHGKDADAYRHALVQVAAVAVAAIEAHDRRQGLLP